jgi:purine-binding chemotaxis protein CheW
MSSPPDVAGGSQYLSFSLAGGEYAIHVEQVKEILQYREITPIPCAPPSIRGVINLRGSVVPVVDLAVKFGRPPEPVGKRTCIVVFDASVGSAAKAVGLVAGSVTAVIDLAPGDVEPPPSFVGNFRLDHLVGVGKVGRAFALILDLERILSGDEREAVRRATDDAPSAHQGGDERLPGRRASTSDCS